MKKSSVSKVWGMLKKSIFGDLLDGVDIDESKITSEEISKLIAQLSKEKAKIAAKEKEEQKRKNELEAARKGKKKGKNNNII